MALNVVPTKTANLVFVIVAPVAKGSRKAYGVYMTPAEYQRISSMYPSYLPTSTTSYPSTFTTSYPSIPTSRKSPPDYIQKIPASRGRRKVYVANIPKGTSVSMGSSVRGNAVSGVVPMANMRFVIIGPRKYVIRGNKRQAFGVFANPQEYRKYATKTGFDFAKFLRDTGKGISRVWLPKTMSTTRGASIGGNMAQVVLFNDAIKLSQALRGGTKASRAILRSLRQGP